MRTLGALYILLLTLANLAFSETSYVEGEHYQLIPIPVSYTHLTLPTTPYV